MQRKRLHKQGPEFSRIIAGAWRWKLEPTMVDRLVRAALDAGITTFDHADIYGDHGNEALFGDVLRKDPSLRRRMELVTKCGIKFPAASRPATRVKHYDTSKAHIVWSAENSLKTLATDHIDLLLIHRPDPLLNPHEVADAFLQLRESGKVLHFGVSNFTPWQFEMLQAHLPFPLVTNQIELSLTHHAPLFDGTLDVLMKHGVVPMAWSPLGGGRLMSEAASQVFVKASWYDATPAQMALAWVLRHPSAPLAVIGTTKTDRIAEAARAADIALDVQDWFEMLSVVQGKEMP